MKRALLFTVAALPGLLLLGREEPRPTLAGAPTAAVRNPARPVGAQLAGAVLAAPFQLVRTPVGGRVVGVYFNEGQTVKTGAPLLKLTVGTGPSSRTVFVSAPVAGDLTDAQVRVGEYLTADTPYGHLTPHGPVRVRVALAEAARLRPGDSLRVLAGPVGLVGVSTSLTALVPDSATTTAVLVLGRVGWPPGTAVEVVLAPLLGPITPLAN